MGSALPLLGLPSKADMYAAALEGLVCVDRKVLEKRPTLPTVYGSGARWRIIPHRTWRRADQIAGEGWGDCEGLSAWRAAECRHYGEDPNARVGVYHTGPQSYHAVVIRGDDNIEDPSVLLGMKVRPNMPRTRGEMNAINAAWPERIGPRGNGQIVVGETWDEQPNATVIDNPDGTSSGKVVIPLSPGQGIIATTAPMPERAAAAAKAATMLADLAKEAVKDPGALKQLAYLNPYTAAAMTLYSEPHINQALKGLGSKGLSLLRHIF